jgi:hypothetical protein
VTTMTFALPPGELSGSRSVLGMFMCCAFASSVS